MSSQRNRTNFSTQFFLFQTNCSSFLCTVFLNVLSQNVWEFFFFRDLCADDLLMSDCCFLRFCKIIYKKMQMNPSSVLTLNACLSFEPPLGFPFVSNYFRLRWRISTKLLFFRLKCLGIVVVVIRKNFECNERPQRRKKSFRMYAR